MKHQRIAGGHLSQPGGESLDVVGLCSRFLVLLSLMICIKLKCCFGT